MNDNPGLVMSLNDPQWGRSGGGGGGGGDDNRGQRPSGKDGPPDLDELWRDFNRRLNSLFGRRGGGSRGPGGFRPDSKGAGIGVIALIVAIVAIWFASGFYIIQEGQLAVVTTFGRYSAWSGPGFRWRMPWPIQQHEVVDVSSVRTVELGARGRGDRLKESLMLTDDENIVDIHFTVQYRIKDGEQAARDFLFNSRFAHDRDPSDVVLQVSESAMREVVGRKTMDSVLYESRQEIADEVRRRMQGMLDRYGTGVLVSAVAIQNAQPPEQVQAAFDDAVKATQDRERQINEGQAYANDVVPRAKGAASRLLQEAEAYRSRVVERAQGDASRFKQVLVEYNKAPAVTRDRLYIETMQQIFASTTKVMVDTRANGNVLLLPFDKLMQQALSEPLPAQRTTPPAPEPAPSETRPRDNSRSRDREAR